MQLRDPSAIGEALRDWVVYEDLSPSYRDYGPREARRIDANRLVRSWSDAQNHAATIRYAGPAEASQVVRAVEDKLSLLTNPKPAMRPVVLPRRLPLRTTVYFVPDRSAVQSQVWFAVDGEPVLRSEAAAADAFGEYFGGSMAGLVFQEVREFRALAYSAAGRLRHDEEPQGSSYVLGYVGCQADKTHEAIDVMMGLLQDMPRYPERINIVRASLRRGLEASSPAFRDLAGSVADWRQRGYSEDPRPQRLLDYEGLSFADIEAFYGKHVAGKPIAIMVVGDPRKVDRKRLEKYGPVVKLRVGDLLSP